MGIVKDLITIIEQQNERITELENELAAAWAYKRVPAPPLNEAQRAIIREHLKLDPIQWVNENADDASLPSMRLR